ncbi:FAD binding domain-containing protein [Paenibacillus wynnii]|uniref:FAD binding domain-containing protein n=1 Tax=Paenibacillus wynnii TaxID=268407 RepID=UPI00278FBE40|nr:FAD binding domain-containing protein [Paenibacillus wynnii]MDQ0195150.1 carbon-monoxide dehydrogenase medium subunit [Paenibacillus wynnii]
MGALRDEGLLGQPGLHQPHSLHEAWELKSALGSGALYVSGGTLLRTQWDAGTLPMPNQLIDLRGVEGIGIGEIRSTEYYLTLGALTTLSLCRKNKYLQSVAPAVQAAVKGIAAPAVRNLATLGGNIASGFGDILPALLVYDAEMVTYDGKLLNAQPLIEWLNSRWEGAVSAMDIVAEVRIPIPKASEKEASRVEVYHKIGRREAFTPSLVTVALTASIDASHRISRVRLAAGGGSGRPQRLIAAEAMLEGNTYEERLLPLVYEAVVNDFETYSDPFASEAYKKKTAGNLIVSELWKAFKV